MVLISDLHDHIIVSLLLVSFQVRNIGCPVYIYVVGGALVESSRPPTGLGGSIVPTSMELVVSTRRKKCV